MERFQSLDKELARTFLAAIKTAGFEYCSIRVRTPHEEEDCYHVAFSHPEWQHYYIENNLHETDPLVRDTRNLPYNHPVIWDYTLALTPEEEHVMEMRKRVTGVEYGITLNINVTGFEVLLALGNPGGCRGFLTAFSDRHPQIITALEELICNLK